jgi:hypothetical protein
LGNALDILMQSGQDRLLDFIRLAEGRKVISSLLTVSDSDDETLSKKADAVIDKIADGLQGFNHDDREKGVLMMTEAVGASVQDGDTT